MPCRDVVPRQPSPRLLFVVLAAVLVVWATTALAGSGTQFSLPALGVKNKSGLRLTIDGRGVDGNGYRPMHIEVTPWPVKPQTADRQIRVVLKPRVYNAMSTPDVSQVVEIPEGSTTATATILVPQSSLWYSLGVETFEGGVKLEDLSHPYLSWPNTTGYWEWTESRPTILFIDADVPLRADRDPAVQTFKTTAADPTPTHDLPDVRQIIWLFPDQNRNAPGTTPVLSQLAGAPQATDNLILSQISDQPRVEMLPLAELPKRWIELSQFDLMIVSYDDLARLQGQHPEVLAAIRDWLSSGTLLLVYGAGDQFERLEKVEQILQLPALPAEDVAAAGPRGWKVPNVKDNVELKNQWTVNNGVFSRGNFRKARLQPTIAAKTKKSTEAAAAPPAADSDAVAAAAASGQPPFVVRPAGLGSVVAIGAADPFPGKETDWTWILNSVEDHHWRWYQRTGFSLHRQNDDYWRFLIPGVGAAPVWPFLLLVTLFAVAIGPVNYMLLGRARRLYLLLITVPAGAALVTISLFAYALATDGLGVRLRLRSFTELDQPAGRAVAWSRQTYYAAIAPSQGVVFPDDTTAFPILYEPARGQNNSGQNDKLVIWDGDQSLRSGYLPSRTTTQFIVQRVTPSEARLVVREGKTPGQPPVVENRLGTPVQQLLLRDSHGDYYSGQTLVAEAQATLTPADPAAVEKALGKLVSAAKPDYPHPKWDPDRHNSAMSFLRTPMGGWMGVDGGAAQPDMWVSLLETNIEAATQPAKHPLTPGTYTAIVDRSPTVPIGVPNAREEASLHVVRGRY